jgi:tRNA uridine 5-carbamoylmethylation protein Kti12
MTAQCPVLIVLVGLPASGKTSIARQLAEHLTPQCPVVRVDPDEIRDALYTGPFLPAREPEVAALRDQQIDAALGRPGFPVVIADDMHYYVGMRRHLRRIAEEREAAVMTVEVVTPVEECIRRNKLRANGLPDALIYELATRYEPPGGRYLWDAPDWRLTPGWGEDDLAAVASAVMTLRSTMPANQTSDEPSVANDMRDALEVVSRRAMHLWITGQLPPSLQGAVAGHLARESPEASRAEPAVLFTRLRAQFVSALASQWRDRCSDHPPAGDLWAALERGRAALVEEEELTRLALLFLADMTKSK